MISADDFTFLASWSILSVPFLLMVFGALIGRFFLSDRW